MRDFYIRFGRRVRIPSTIQILDEISPHYRARLIREHRDRVRQQPAPAILPDLMRGSVERIETSIRNVTQ
jgi:hypothetical protein